VLDTDQSDWEKLLDFLPGSPWPWQFTIDDKPAEFPVDVSTLFPENWVAGQYSPFLRLDVAGLTLHCHFFCPEQIEFDLDPREVASDQRLSAIIDFLATIGRLLGRTVILTPESLRQRPYFRFDPHRQTVMYVP
jgi:hypothetical protein